MMGSFVTTCGQQKQKVFTEAPYEWRNVTCKWDHPFSFANLDILNDSIQSIYQSDEGLYPLSLA